MKNNTFLANTSIVYSAVMWFANFFGIKTPEFISALTDVTMSSVYNYYEEKGIDFDFDHTAIEKDAMLFAFDRIMAVAQLATIAKACGMTEKDFE